MMANMLFLNLGMLLSYTGYCTVLQNDDNAYLKSHVLSSDEASFKNLMEQVSVMQSDNRQLLERIDRIESENRQLFELLERLLALESDNRQLLERQSRLESDNNLYKKEIHWLNTELMLQQAHTDSMDKLIEKQQAELDELKQIAQTTDASLSTGTLETLKNKTIQPVLLHAPHAAKEHVRPRIRRTAGTLQVAFFATLTNTQMHLGYLQNIAFDHVETNIGNSYDNNSGVFRAPEAGTYVFSTTLMTHIDHTTYYGIYLNLRQVSQMLIMGQQKSYDTESQTVVLHLNKGDDVSVKHTRTDRALEGAKQCIFSGFMLYQDENIDPAIIGR